MTPGMRASAAQLTWTRQGGLVAVAIVGGDTAFLQRRPRPRRARRRRSGAGPSTCHARWGTSAAFSADGATVAAGAGDRRSSPPRCGPGPIGRWTQGSQVNAGLRSPAARVESLSWKSDRWEVQGWLYLPPEDALPGEAPAGGRACTAARRGVATEPFPITAAGAGEPGIRRAGPESPRQLRAGRGVHPGQREGLRARGPARHPRRRGGGGAYRPGRRRAGWASAATATAGTWRCSR